MDNHFSPMWGFQLNWRIRYSDTMLDMGHLKYDRILDPTEFVGDETDGADEDLIQPVELIGNWDKVLPIFVNEMSLDEEPDRLSIIRDFEVPPYEEASFWLSDDKTGIYANWGLRGRGFGQYYITLIGGHVSINNEFTSKDTIYNVLKCARVVGVLA